MHIMSFAHRVMSLYKRCDLTVVRDEVVWQKKAVRV